MNFKQLCLSNKFVWFWIYLVCEMVTLAHGNATSYGKEFVLPYLNFCKNVVSFQIVPTYRNSQNIALTIELKGGQIIYKNNFSQSEVLNIEFSDIFTNGSDQTKEAPSFGIFYEDARKNFEISKVDVQIPKLSQNKSEKHDYAGMILKTSEMVSVYLKRLKGDVTLMIPTASLGTEYVLPEIPQSTNHLYRIILYAIQNNTTINITTNTYWKLLNTSSNVKLLNTSSIVNRLTSNVTANFQNVSANFGAENVTNIPENTTEMFSNVENVYYLNSYESLVLETDNLTTSSLTSDRSIGIVLLVMNEADSGANCDLHFNTIESIPPRSSNGKLFYFSRFEQQANLTFSLTGNTEGSIIVETDTQNCDINVTSIETVQLDFPTAKFVSLVATVPIQVYVTTVVVISETQDYILNDFILPSYEQFLRCSINASCYHNCPQFFKGSNKTTSFSDQYVITDANRSIKLDLNLHTIDTQSNKAIAKKIWTNSSFMYILCDTTLGALYPIGTSLQSLYSACSVQSGSIGDGIDNDCDGFTDEEHANNKDDDNDDMIDEDTHYACVQALVTTPAHFMRVAPNTYRAPRLEDIPLDVTDSTMPLIAVVLSLSAAIFAVFAVISIFMFLELLSRRKQLRNTKIRPFVS